MSIAAQAADFTVNFTPADSSVADQQVSSISQSKINSLGSSLLAAAPVGTVSMFAGSAAPTGWLLARGQVVLNSDYPVLFAVIGCTFGTSNVCPDGTHFKLPDLQGVFVRGASSQVINSLTYDGGAVGQKQNDQFQDHAHPLGFDIGTVTNGSNAGGDTHSQFVWGNGSANGTWNASKSGATGATGLSGGNPRIGSETRPVNVTLNYMIKVN